ncbi:N-acetylmuramoyl-L-alanine amidase [Xanthomonas sp. Sa3BUA13]|nr:N-acetylmuramoyl-L-alanine amidase [Xanthomonas surreyensis]
MMLSAGHGLYLDYPVGKPTVWLPQRPLPSNGITEDFITPGYVSEISSALTERGSQVAIVKPRSDSTAIHTPSGEPWWKVSAKYNLQSILPTHGADIWDTLPYDTSKLREYNEDIRARPLYANYLGADYLVSIHTNAGTNTASRGTTGWYHNGDYAEPSRLLTSNILCSMKEIIQANSTYANWTIDTVPRGVTNKGENTLARLPATIIEVAFHTNADDAIALQDATFRTLAGKGIAKGIEINKDGKTCSKFKIDSIPASTGPQGSQVPYKVNYSGNPTFPVTMYFEPVKCAPGWTCQTGTRTTTSTSSPLTFQFSCGSGTDASSTSVFKRWLVDADGVKTDPVEATHTCVKSSSKTTPLINDGMAEATQL